ncbi:23S rRNA (adenine(2030)-N(6))-methyltransferase RlmJ [Methylophilus aquaticus]|uniref:Ribosomal RNA large subunit methyltransferase J n=1 Tax=Methylophilus aquaticus TaxID=1971610 RepID=A0ABT9JUA1_9PROT|nr:23S rRNA (adenine(2030)-N(6))-methyltransferase RlmJ [Methylophilus aquaticus]MDP8568157.1 23S rRNA (adenine(2030)-N(6))-methyltransferase RlmJ [Methylophilus aquaticus]
MLSYRHAFHAGNHADVLKHWIYSLVLDYFNQKDKPYWVMDTHAGAGVYQLESAMAHKTAEYREGIARLQQATDRPQTFAIYMQAVQALHHKISPQVYPGSPAIAMHFLRDSDKLRLFELHPADHALLTEYVAPFKRQVQVAMKDGFEGIKACLPPPTKRGVVLIDPPYELKEDYQRVVDCIKESLKRFATGTYLVWYPLLQRPEPALMIEKLQALNTDYVHVTLHVSQPGADGFGMFGSGMLILNPPWTLANQIEPCLPWLASTLAQDASANAQMQVRIR